MSAGVEDGGYGWGTVAVDFNHDGLLDIAETNGGSGTGGDFGGEQTYLWINSGSGSFTEMAVASGLIHNKKGRGLVNLDYDNDGDQDVVIFANGEAVELFRNDLSGPGTNWIRIFLDASTMPNVPPEGIGSRIIVTIGGTSQLRYMIGGDSFLSHSERSAHFGLGSASVIDEIRVEWPDGSVTTVENVAANQTMTLPMTVTGVGSPDVSDKYVLHQNYPNPFNPTTTIAFTLHESAHVTISIFDSSGKRITTLEDAPRLTGLNQVRWDGRDERGSQVASGVYYYRVKVGNDTLTKKMILLK